MFIVIVISIFGLQILLVTFTGAAFSVYNNFGLHPLQWLLSVNHLSYFLDWNWFIRFDCELLIEIIAFRQA